MRRAMPLVFIAWGTACGGDDAAVTPDAGPPTGPMTVEVTRYEYAFDLATRAATATVHLDVTGEGNCVTLPMRADLEGDVTLDGAPAEATVEGEALTACGAGWRAGDAIALVAAAQVPLETWGDSQVGFSITNDANGAPFYYLVSWVGGCDRFGPCDHRPDRFARYAFTVTHPEGVTVLCPGTVAAGPTETTCTFDHDGGPTYSTFGLAASAGWTMTDGGAWDGLAVTFYNRTGSRVVADLDATWQSGFLAWMQARFGAYPYGDSLRVITAPTYWAGFEHPGNIVLSDTLGGTFGNAFSVNHTMAHELAHQWAGDETTLADTYDFVWKESMAEYLSFVYEDEHALATTPRTAIAWKGYANGALYHPVPDERPALLDYYGEVYGPGPMILFRQLEALTSREAVLTAIASVLGDARALSVDALVLALEDATGADLDAYADAWLRGAGAPAWPRFAIATSAAGPGSIDVTVTQTAPAEARPCAFHVRLAGAAEGEVLDVRFDRGGLDGWLEQTVTVDVPFAVTSTTLDPLAECLAYPAGAAAAPLHPRGWTPWRSLE